LDPNPTDSCPECELTIVDCLNLNTSEDCSTDWTPATIPTLGGTFFCYTYNTDPKNPIYSKTTGYSGSLSTMWKVLKFNATDPPNQNRAGLQVTFIPNDGTPIDPTQIYTEVRFAAMDLDSFYALTEVSTVHTEKKTSDPNYNITRYDAVSSSVTLLSLDNATYGYAAISFSFQTLSMEVVQYSISYQLINLFGDFAGMIGTLMGLDSIKVTSAIPMVYLAIKLRNLNPLEDHFNGSLCTNDQIEQQKAANEIGGQQY